MMKRLTASQARREVCDAVVAGDRAAWYARKLREAGAGYAVRPGGEYIAHPAYAALKARFPNVKMDGGGMTPEQGRVCFHQERLFRSTGGGIKAHARYIAMCERDGALPKRIGLMTRMECARALFYIEQACRAEGLHLFRDVRTQWEELTSPQG